jgi:heat shock protein HslJ
MMVTVAGIILVLLAAACVPTESAPNEGAALPTAKPTEEAIPTEEAVPTEQPEISNINWSLIQTIVGGDAVVPAPDFAHVFFQIEEDMIYGNSGCNTFRGSITIEGHNIEIGPLATTRMACDVERMTLEEAILDILNNTATYSVTDNTLELQNADGLPLASFAEAEEKTLFVGSEMVECVGVAPQQCLLVKEDPNAEYEFFYDDIAGFEWEAGYEYELLVSVTERTEPLADASSLQYRLIEVVSTTPVSAESASPSLTGTIWQWHRFESSDGSTLIVPDPALYTLEFMEDGTYTIQADCNSGSGTYTVDSNSITIQPGPMTLVACGEDSLDGDFLSRLGDVVTFVFDDEENLVLNLMMDAGNMVFAPADA